MLDSSPNFITRLPGLHFRSAERSFLRRVRISAKEFHQECVASYIATLHNMVRLPPL